METTKQAKQLHVQSFLDFVKESMASMGVEELKWADLQSLWNKWEDFVYEVNFQIRLGK